ncbi:MAG: winged helix-turn-helix domain-containing protein, partial [Pseudomonadota bacterium]
MKEGPDIAALAGLIGDPARANMLAALMSGRALTATELAAEAGVTAQTTSAHLKKLTEGGLVAARKQGRHRYFALASDEVGGVLEGLMGLAAGQRRLRARPGPRDPALRRARVCYDHLAGEAGVAMFDALKAAGRVEEVGEDVRLTDAGCAFAEAFGVAPSAPGSRRPDCLACLDWSMRRTHLAGALGAGLLARIYDLGWARRVDGSRAVAFTTAGAKGFEEAF